MTVQTQYDPTDAAVAALGAVKVVPPNKTTTSYNNPGLPKPPAGWGKVISFKDTVDNDDEGPEAPDEH